MLCYNLVQAWSKHLRQHKKKKGSKAQASTAPANLAAQDAGVQCLTQAQQALQALLQEVQQAAQHLLQGSCDAAGLLAEFDDSSNARLKALVGWEPQLSVQLVLSDLVKQQRGLLAQM